MVSRLRTRVALTLLLQLLLCCSWPTSGCTALLQSQLAKHAGKHSQARCLRAPAIESEGSSTCCSSVAVRYRGGAASPSGASTGQEAHLVAFNPFARGEQTSRDGSTTTIITEDEQTIPIELQQQGNDTRIPLVAPRGYVREGVPARAASVQPGPRKRRWRRWLHQQKMPPPPEPDAVQEVLSNVDLPKVEKGALIRKFFTTPVAMSTFAGFPLQVRSFIIGRCLGLPLTATSGQVFRVMFAKLSGLAIIAGSVGLKLPQIARIMDAKSVLGLSILANYFEVPLVGCSIIYHVKRKYPFSAYGENVFILLQNLAIVGLIWKHADPKVERSAMALIATAFIMISMASYSLPDHLQPLLVLASAPLVVMVTVPQILINWKQGHTGQMSPVTCALKLVGSGMRLATTLIEIGYDKPLLLNYGLGTVLNGVLCAQWYLHRDATAKAVGEDVVEY